MDAGNSRIKLIAVGNSNYEHLNLLRGPENDISDLKSLLVENNKTSSLEEHQCTWLIDAKCADLRKAITTWSYSISGTGDILILYFSGHGAVLPNHDFGLCMVDTQNLPGLGEIIVTSLIPIGEILLAISSRKAYPFVILDSCYSGGAISQFKSSFDSIKSSLQGNSGNSYGLLASCYLTEESIDIANAGLFSKTLFKLSSRGMKSIKHPYLTLTDLYSDIRKEIEGNCFEMHPLVFLGETMPKFSWVKNVTYQPVIESLVSSYVEVLHFLWNNGTPLTKSPSEIGQNVSSGGYANNSKLMLAPWSLITHEIGKRSKKLTEKGISFMKGEISVPKTIVKDVDSDSWIAMENCKSVWIKDFPKKVSKKD